MWRNYEAENTPKNNSVMLLLDIHHYENNLNHVPITSWPGPTSGNHKVVISAVRKMATTTKERRNHHQESMILGSLWSTFHAVQAQFKTWKCSCSGKKHLLVRRQTTLKNHLNVDVDLLKNVSFGQKTTSGGRILCSKWLNIWSALDLCDI